MITVELLHSSRSKRETPSPGYYLLSATRADLLRRLGRSDEAVVAYREALDLVTTDAERRYLTRRLAETSQARS